MLYRFIVVLALCGLILSACSAPPPPHADAVLLGRLFDARSGSVTEQGELVIADGRILCAGARGSCTWPDATPVHDHGRAMLLPGLIDLHIHARPHYIGAFVPSGVTTVRDAGNKLDTIAALRAAPLAPRILATGPLLDGPDSVLTDGTPSRLGDGPLSALHSITIATADEAVAAVDALAEAGVDWIKLYEQLPPETFAAAAQAADRHGLPVMTDLGTVLTRGLTGAQIDAHQAALAGVATLEHLGGAALAYRRLGGDPNADTLDPALLDRLVAMLADSGVAIVPTAANGAQFTAPDSLARDDLPGAARIAPYFASYWAHLEGVLATPTVRERSLADARLLKAMLPRLLAAGVTIGAGSDVPAAPYILPGPALHQELEALVRAGLTPAQALQAATHDAAAILQRPDLGRLEAGARADIVVVDGDPVTDIGDSRKVNAVWKDGAPVDLPAAWDAVGDALRAAEAEAEHAAE